MKISNTKVWILTTGFFLSLTTGCITTPLKEPLYLKGPTYHIDHTPYITLNSIIDAYGLDYKWDSVSKKLTLCRDGKKIILCVGSNVLFANEQSKILETPVRIRQGVIIVPKDFATYILSDLFLGGPEVAAPKIEGVKTTPGYTVSKIVLDPGHGGKDPGAIGQFGIIEKKISLDIAKRVKHYLEDFNINVIMTRDEDKFVSLWQRADMANKGDADFFISIHANASPSMSVSGFEVYYLSEAIDDNARAVAAAENASLKYENSSFGNIQPSSTLEATLWDIAYTENRQESIELAKCIADESHSLIGIANRGIKAARFYVLKGAKMPSVLIEVGFISNRKEAKRLNDSKYRNTLARAIIKGILAYKKEYEQTEGFTR